MISEPRKVFLEKISEDLLVLLKHGFFAKSQATHLQELEDAIEEKELIVTLDFSENYSFEIQNEIQSHRWSKDQVTLHVYVVYYRETM